MISVYIYMINHTAIGEGSALDVDKQAAKRMTYVSRWWISRIVNQGG